MSSSSNSSLSNLSASSSIQKIDDYILSQFQIFWNIPIKVIISDAFKKDPTTCDYNSLFLRLVTLSAQDLTACNKFIKSHQNASILSPHELSILGTIYLTQNKFSQAKEYFESAVKENDVWALNCLGYMYRSGYGVAQDYHQAHHLFEQAAKKGNAEALANLGVIYQNGDGVTKDDEKAAAYYRQAAVKNDTKALRNLRLLQSSNPDNLTILYHAAIATKDKNLLNELSLSIDDNPENFIDIASQDSRKKLLASLGAIHGKLLIELIIKHAVNKIAPRFNEIYHSIPNVPSNLIALISSYDEKKEPVSKIQKIKNLFYGSDDDSKPFLMQDDYITAAVERCRIQAEAKVKVTPFIASMEKASAKAKYPNFSRIPYTSLPREIQNYVCQNIRTSSLRTVKETWDLLSENQQHQYVEQFSENEAKDKSKKKNF